MEYVEGIDLYDLLEKVGQIPPDVAAIMLCWTAKFCTGAPDESVTTCPLLRVTPNNVMAVTAFWLVSNGRGPLEITGFELKELSLGAALSNPLTLI